MKQIVLFLVLLAASQAHAQGIHTPDETATKREVTTISSLPSCNSGTIGTYYAVSDGTTGSDCSVGGGSTYLVCECDGSSWVATGGGMGAGLWEAGTNGTYEDDAAVIVGADAAFDSDGVGTGGVGDMKVADDLEVGDNIWFGSVAPSTIHFVSWATPDGTDDEAIVIGNSPGSSRGAFLTLYGNDFLSFEGNAELFTGDASNAYIDIKAAPTDGSGTVTITTEQGVTDTSISVTDVVTISSDSTGDAEVVLPDDAIGPDEILAAGQVDTYLLTYELTGDTWSWTDPASIGGAGLWLDGTNGLWPGSTADPTTTPVHVTQTDIAETISSTQYADTGGDLFVQNDLGVEATIFVDNNLRAGTNTVYTDISQDEINWSNADYFVHATDNSRKLWLCGGTANTAPNGAFLGLYGDNDGGWVVLDTSDALDPVFELTNNGTNTADIDLIAEDGATDNTFTVGKTGFAFTGNSGDNVLISEETDLEIEETGGTDTATIVAPALTASTTITLPDASGTPVVTNGAGSTWGGALYGAGSIAGGTSWDTGDEVAAAAGVSCDGTFNVGSATPINCSTTHTGPFWVVVIP